MRFCLCRSYPLYLQSCSHVSLSKLKVSSTLSTSMKTFFIPLFEISFLLCVPFILYLFLWGFPYSCYVPTNPGTIYVPVSLRWIESVHNWCNTLNYIVVVSCCTMRNHCFSWLKKWLSIGYFIRLNLMLSSIIVFCIIIPFFWKWIFTVYLGHDIVSLSATVLIE